MGEGKNRSFFPIIHLWYLCDLDLNVHAYRGAARTWKLSYELKVTCHGGKPKIARGACEGREWRRWIDGSSIRLQYLGADAARCGIERAGNTGWGAYESRTWTCELDSTACVRREEEARSRGRS